MGGSLRCRPCTFLQSKWLVRDRRSVSRAGTRFVHWEGPAKRGRQQTGCRRTLQIAVSFLLPANCAGVCVELVGGAVVAHSVAGLCKAGGAGRCGGRPRGAAGRRQCSAGGRACCAGSARCRAQKPCPPATSHTLTAARHTAVDLRSTGQAGSVPVHFSAAQVGGEGQAVSQQAGGRSVGGAAQGAAQPHSW